jgi:FkbM family methyltransferase
MAAALKRHPDHDPGVSFFMRRHARFPFFDVGANVGFFTIMAARMGGPVIAIEPDEQNLPLLRRNLASAEVEATILPVACAAEDGSLRMGKMTCGRSAKARDQAIEVHCRSIRSLAAEFGVPGFIKLDIEGGETDALLGMEGPECSGTIIEAEFSWRDHGRRFGDWLRVRPPGPYRWTFLLGEEFSDAEPVELPDKRYLVSADDESSLNSVVQKLTERTEERPSRKWELCIVPRDQ